MAFEVFVEDFFEVLLFTVGAFGCPPPRKVANLVKAAELCVTTVVESLEPWPL
jgi:hypothetical protein